MARKKIATAARETEVPAAKPAPELDRPAAVVAPAIEVAAAQAAGAADGFNAPKNEVSKTMDNVMKSAEDFVAFSQGNVEAMIKASQIWAAGVQDISKTFAATAQAQMDATMSNFKALAGVKSIKDVVELQTSLTRSSVETAVTEASKLTDASMKLAEQAMAPIAERVTLAVEKFGRAA